MYIVHIRSRLYSVFNEDNEREYEGTLEECRVFLASYSI